MSEKELYKKTFEQLHTKVNPEDLIGKKYRRRPMKTIWAVAALIGLMVAFSVTAYAMNFFGLKDLVLKNSYTVYVPDAPTDNQDDEDVPMKKIDVASDMISLQGYPDSNEYKAVMEWTAFVDSYDPDGVLLKQVGNGPTGLDSKYILYYVYTQEMADKLEEIVAKYNLKLHEEFIIIDSYVDLLRETGKGDFLGSSNINMNAYMYRDGTFQLDGAKLLRDNLVIDYQMRYIKKGYFDEVVLNIQNADDYEEWSYRTSSGVTVSLSIGPSKALVIFDTGDAFVTINVLAGTETGFIDETRGINKSDLESFADTFDFSALF